MNSEIEEFSKKVLLINTIISMILIIVLLITLKYSWALGILLGSTSATITFLMHVKNTKRLGIDIKHPTRNAFANSILRLSVSALALLIAFFIPWINIIATFIGLMIIKVVIFIVSFLIGNREKKEGED